MHSHAPSNAIDRGQRKLAALPWRACEKRAIVVLTISATLVARGGAATGVSAAGVAMTGGRKVSTKVLAALPAALPAASAAAFSPVAARLVKASVAALMGMSPRARRLMRAWALPGLGLARVAGMVCKHKH